MVDDAAEVYALHQRWYTVVSFVVLALLTNRAASPQLLFTFLLEHILSQKPSTLIITLR
jgi:hypothetical protein